MTADAAHPSPAQLNAFGTGRLSDREARVVAAHLERCDACRRCVEDRARDVHRQETVGPSVAAGPPNPTTYSGAGVPLPPPPGLPVALLDHPRYRVVKELGRGGMGVVYEAQHRLMDRRVALKLINRAVLDHPDALARFHTEVRNAAKLHHPNIVTAFDAEQAGDLHMLVMEYVEGSDLAKVLDKRGPFPLLNACHYVRQAALGLQHAFEKGMIHRDVKPQNLMLTPQGQVKILDFGLARVASEGSKLGGLTQEGVFMGTPEYVSPEQAVNARTADIRADVYSLGCTLYALLAGRPPFRGETVMATVLAQIEKEPPPLTRLRAEVPAELWSVVAKMLAKDPAARYQTPGEAARALAPFTRSAAAGRGTQTQAKAEPSETQAAAFEGLAGGDVVPPRPRRKRRAARAGKKNVWMIAGGAGGAGALLLAVVLALVFRKTDGADTGKVPRTAKGADVAAADRIVTNSLGMKLAFIPNGTFLMGSPADEEDREPDEQRHEVEITRPFYLGVHEVAQDEYEKVMGTNPSAFSPAGKQKAKVAGMDTRRFPVEEVSWSDAVEFCRKLSELPEEKRAGRVYRLPTEAEWEYACRAGTTTAFAYGSSLAPTQANFDGTLPSGGAAKGPYRERPTDVASHEPNAFGLYNMHGNVWEWCLDPYGDYAPGPQKDPEGPPNGDRRVMRGGSWHCAGKRCRAAVREHDARDSRYENVGFRVALSAARAP